ncbi:P-loop containing nucleoside triphosphate hydrolase protein [Dothidotthia symphoricarpi CBS 119687]|uniref:RNA helicase n=1 Tax=Dothidotthia symphoricarpi CBS 119687 TaxID=1392245 RepID=A0A6A6ARR6_9PLEO|nr:P-loop containing nucleoside triphosphate hydrolase protein [Dothidotthia symphoricarpi CBS 119687]KAF2134510.1 P-loop containing nucleoside triphosphate hydrolase protein [Dothidotthia symphoricarpi CBS 119687]
MSDPKRRRTDEGNASELRLKSRQSYLQKREAEQLALLRRQVAEEADEQERLGSKLSKAEIESFRRNRETLRLAEARNAIDEHLDGYILPDADYSNKSEVLTRRHKEKEKGYEKSEVQLWEDEQTAKVKAQISKPKRTREEDYEFVFDESHNIKFMADAAGNINPDTIDLARLEMQSKLDAAELKVKTIQDTRKSLPVYKYREELLEALSNHQVLVVVGETGSGKSTQIPQFVAAAGYTEKGAIAITQPRRVAAMSVSQRVAEEYGCKLGGEVGYSVRFEDRTSPKTTIKFATDGVLLREAMSDVQLSKYSVIMIDEAHERSLASDLLLVLCREICRSRPEMKLLILSATINASHFSAYFDDAPVFNIPGRTWPVQVNYTMSPEANYLSAAITTVFQIHIAAELPGDILVFLTGEEEIQAAAEALESTQKKLGGRVKELVICPIYSALPPDVQAKAFEPTKPNTRKVVLATNIAETSITIDGIRHVIDSGYAKESSFNPKTGLSSLTVSPISRASANQRSGRAGRTSAGFCYRLYTKHAFYNDLSEATEPEIQRANLDGVVLTLKSLGISNLLDFEFIDPPSSDALIKSLEGLYALGALDSNGALTRLGRRMAELPLDIKLSKAMLESEKFGCRDEILSIVSVLGESASLFLRPKDKKVAADSARNRFSDREGGDFLTYLNIWNQFVESGYDSLWCRENFLQYRTLNRAREVREQLEKLADRVEVPPSSCSSDDVAIRKAITAGFFPNAARLQRDGQSFRTVTNGLTVYIHPSSTLMENRPRWCVFAELVATSKEYMRSCMPIDPAWLVEVAPHMHTETSISKLGDDKKMGKGPGKVGVDR